MLSGLSFLSHGRNPAEGEARLTMLSYAYKEQEHCY